MALCAAVLSLGLSACGGGGGKTVAEPDPSPEMAAVAAAEMAVEGLTAMSDDAAVEAADAAVDAAKTAVEGAAGLTMEEMEALEGRIAAAERDLAAAQMAIADYREHRTQAMDAVDAAEMAVMALTAMSEDADVTAADAAVAAAKTAVAGAAGLPASEAGALRERIAAAELALAARRTEIADYRAHSTQHATAMAAVEAAEMAVMALTAMSSDADVEMAAAAIAAARAAVYGTEDLTGSEIEALVARIETAEMTLETARMDIADYEEHRTQAMAAVDAAEMAVMALTAMSDDAAVAAADGLVEAAEMAVAAAAGLPDSEAGALRERIAAAGLALTAKQTEIAGYRERRTLAMDAVDAAEMAVMALTAMSSDADVTAADAAVDAATAAVAGAAGLPDSEASALRERITKAELDLAAKERDIATYREHSTQYADAMAAVDAAEMAVMALTAMSDDADVAAAEMAIAEARTAVFATDDLTGSEVEALLEKIEMAETGLADAQMEIAAYREHGMQYAAAMDAVDAAEMAVMALTAMSGDAAVMEAKDRIEAAEMAVADGSMLSDAEMAALNGDIMAAKTMLAATEAEIAAYREHGSQHAAAMGAVERAEMAVMALTEMSSTADADMAEMALDAAEAALMAGAMLTEAERTALEGRIALARLMLQDKNMEIAVYMQRTAANEAVEAARMAVAELTPDSTDAEVMAAMDLIEAAKTAVADGMNLTQAEMQALNDSIADVEMDLAAAEMDIEDRRMELTADRINELHGIARRATAASMAAHANARDAVREAAALARTLANDMGNVGIRHVENVHGDSALAARNAQAVLDVRDAVDVAAAEAEGALADAEAAEAEADALADGTEGKTGLVAAIDTAIDAVETALATIEAIRDGPAGTADTVTNAIRPVVGTNANNPRTAADVGREVANAVETMLTRISTGAANAPGLPEHSNFHSNTSGITLASRPVLLSDGPYYGSDSEGETWAEIVGEANIRMERIGADNAETPVASIDGMTGTEVSSDLVAGTTPLGDGGTLTGGGSYMGIEGAVYCLSEGGNCSVAADGMLTGGWHFTPTNRNTPYVRNAAGAYAAETFNEWGYWIGQDGATTPTGELKIQRYAIAGRNTAGLDYGTGTPGTATYSGEAGGMSFRKIFAPDGRYAIHSGHFDADIRLTATFGTTPTPMLGGTIDNFRPATPATRPNIFDPGEVVGDMHVNPGWTATIPEVAFDAGRGSGLDIVNAAVTTPDTVVATDPNPLGQGAMDAEGYGPSGQHPAGFVGGFNAFFVDGSVAGVFHATRQ